jgi:sodium transport system permease protein
VLVLRTELLSLVRDRRAIASAILLPVLLYPLLFLGHSWLQRASREGMAARMVVVGLDLQGVAAPLATALRERLAEEPPIELVEVDADAVRSVAEGVHAGLTESIDADLGAARALLADGSDALLTAIPHPDLSRRAVFRLHVDGTEDLSNEAGRRVRAALSDLEHDQAASLRARVLGSTDPGRGLDAELVDVASSEAAGGAALGRLLPLLSVLVVLSGGAFGALAAFAGERESQTLETLLVQPVPAAPVAWGKFIAVLLLALAALASNGGSLVLSVAMGLGDLPGVQVGASGQAPSLVPGLGRLGLGAVAFLPAVVLLCSLLCLVSARAQSFREGQHLLLPLTLIAALPAAAAGWGEVELDPATALVPLFGQGLALRDALLGRLPLLSGAVAFVSGTAWSWLALRHVGHLLDAERVLSTEADEREQELRGTQSRTAVAWGFAAVLLIYLVGGRLQAWRPVAGLLLTLLVLAPALAIAASRGTARRARGSVAQVLSLRPARWVHLLGALLAAPGFATLMRLWVPLQQRLLPMPSGQLAESGPLAEMLSLPLVLLVATLGIAPALGEELLFRGAIQGGLARDLPARKVAGWQALLFGLAHASVYRFVPTAALGACLSLVVVRSRSLLPAVLLHAAYNTILVVGERWEPLADPRLAWLSLAGLALLSLPASPARGGRSL